jgi:hypothetical protein
MDQGIRNHVTKMITSMDLGKHDELGLISHMLIKLMMFI